jgi:hypothetical protein
MTPLPAPRDAAPMNRPVFEVIAFRDCPMPAFRSLLAVLACATLAMAEPVTVHTVAGKELQGELVRLDAAGIVVRVKDKGKEIEVKTTLTDVLDIQLQGTTAPTALKYTDVELVDGTLLHCGEVRILEREVHLKLVAGHALTVPLSAVASILNDAQDRSVREEWKRLLGKQGSRDMIAIKKQGVVNTLEGTLHEGDKEGKTIGFELKGRSQKVPVRIERIHAMAFFRKREGNLEDPLCKLTDTSGDLLVVMKIDVAGGAYTFTTGAKVKLEFPVAQLAKLDFRKGKLLYLSEIDPANVKVTESPGLEGTDRFKRDKNLDGGALRINGVAYARGLAVPATSELVFDIGGEYKHFKAILGFDDQVGGDSNVRILVEGDGRELFKVDFRRGDKKVVPMVVDVKNVKSLRIVVSSLDLLDLGYHVNFADAKVSK